MRAVFDHLVRIAALDALIREQVVFALQMYELKSILSRIIRRENGGKGFIFHLDGGFARFQCGGVFGHDERDCVA